MNLPEGFVRTVRATYDDGAAWLESLPDLLAEAADAWGLTLDAPFANLSYNYVAPAECADGTDAVFKAGPPNPELTSEMAALAVWDGRGAARLLRSDPTRGWLLVERLRPGDLLTPMADTDDDAATRIAAAAMAALWRPLPEGHAFPDLARWTRELSNLRRFFGGGTGPFPERLVARAESLREELLATQSAPVLLHGDLHHHNILRAGGDVWRAIDPKGLAGEPCYEVTALLRNPDISGWPDLEAKLARRVEILAQSLGFAPERMLAWALVQTVLSIWWGYDESDPSPDPSSWAGDLRVAEALDRLL